MHKGISNAMFYSLFKAQSSLKASESFCGIFSFGFFFFHLLPSLFPFLAISINRALVMLKIQVPIFLGVKKSAF